MIGSATRRSSSAIWRRTTAFRAALGPLTGIAATVALVPLVSAVLVVLTMALTRRRTGSARGTVAASWRFLPKLTSRVRPGYWWALVVVALLAEFALDLPWLWPVSLG